MRSKIITLLVSAIFLLDCSDTKVAPTQLKITITDSSGNPASGVSVNLYSAPTPNSSLYLINAKPVITGTDGVALFSDLYPTNYIWFATRGNYGCESGESGTSRALTANVVNNATTVIKSWGTMFFTDQSSDTYLIKINGSKFDSLFFLQETIHSQMPIGTYNIEIIQQTGFTTNPIDEKSTVVLNCGDSLKISFP